MKIIIFILLTLIILSCSDIFGTTYKTEIEILNSEMIIKLKNPPPKGTYKCTIKIEGTAECELKYRITRDGNIYKIKPITTEIGNLNELIYKGDWYGAKPGLIITPINYRNDCNSKLTIKYTYYY